MIWKQKHAKKLKKMDEKGVEAFSSRKSEIRFNIDREENKVKARQDPLDVVPLNFFSPTNEVMVRGRRAVTLTDRMKSPFYIKSDVLFETKYGQQSSRGQIETLGPQEPVDGNVLSSWSVYLNFMEEKKDSISPAILFFPTFEVIVRGNFTWQTDRREKDCRIFLMRHMECYMGGDIGKWKCDLDVEGKKHNTQLGHLRNKYAAKLLLSDCNIYKDKIREEMDGKFSSPRKKVTRKKKKDDDIDDVRVASKLYLIFGQYLYAINHGKAAAILECRLVRGNFSWQTNRRAKDYGIFLMRHMESYMGSDIGKWKCGLDVEGKKQNTQLGHLRNKYATKLLLADCNIFKGKIRDEMDGK
ncbi:hypothetical protein Tco_0794563 [Tanacetum coccineum]